MTDNYLPYVYAFLIAAPFYVLFRDYFNRIIKLKDRQISISVQQKTSPEKLNACERMTLFLERIKPAALSGRFGTELAPHEFVFLAEKSITEEFEYNSAQQLYISAATWQEIVFAKNFLLKLLHETYEKTSNNADLSEYKTIFLMSYIHGEDVIDTAMAALKGEIMARKAFQK